MHLVGFLRLTIALGIWMLGAASIPIAIGCAYFQRYEPLYFLIFYYVFRKLFPATKWPLIPKLLQLNPAPYCNNQSIVFEKGASAPEPNTKTMIAVSPHGILTIGWMMTVDCDPSSFSSSHCL
jgi:hypothetical protein